MATYGGISFGVIGLVALCCAGGLFWYRSDNARRWRRRDPQQLMQDQVQIDDRLGQFQPDNPPLGACVPTGTPVPVAAMPKGGAPTSGGIAFAAHPAVATSVQPVEATVYPAVTAGADASVPMGQTTAQATSHPTSCDGSQPEHESAQPQPWATPKFDPQTGKPIDPNTGKPIPKFDPNTGVQNW